MKPSKIPKSSRWSKLSTHPEAGGLMKLKNARITGLRVSLSTHPEAGGLMKHRLKRRTQHYGWNLSTHPEAGGLMKHCETLQEPCVKNSFQPTQRREG